MSETIWKYEPEADVREILRAERERIRKRLLERADALDKYGPMPGATIAGELRHQAGELLADDSLPLRARTRPEEGSSGD